MALSVRERERERKKREKREEEERKRERRKGKKRKGKASCPSGMDVAPELTEFSPSFKKPQCWPVITLLPNDWSG
jgi:septal ring factor EnvC (AmiA/AmiB activator)